MGYEWSQTDTALFNWPEAFCPEWTYVITGSGTQQGNTGNMYHDL